MTRGRAGSNNHLPCHSFFQIKSIIRYRPDSFNGGRGLKVSQCLCKLGKKASLFISFVISLVEILTYNMWLNVQRLIFYAYSGREKIGG